MAETVQTGGEVVAAAGCVCTRGHCRRGSSGLMGEMAGGGGAEGAGWWERWALVVPGRV